MENPHFIQLPNGSQIIADKNGELWLPMSAVPPWSYKPEIVQIGDDLWFDVIGFSESRLALLLQPIKIDGAADDIDEELRKYLAEQ